MVPNSAAIAAQNTYKLYRYSNDIKYLNIVGESMESVSGLIDKSPLDLPSWFKLYYLMGEENSEIERLKTIQQLSSNLWTHLQDLQGVECIQAHRPHYVHAGGNLPGRLQRHRGTLTDMP